MNRKVLMVSGAMMIMVGYLDAVITHLEYAGSHIDHIVPASSQEAIAVLICVIIMMTGFVLATIGLALPKK